MTVVAVSVVMPVRNAATTVADQLAALAAQDFDGAWELVTVDNGSTDRSRTIIQGFASAVPALRIVEEPHARGAAHARNVGAGAARGRALAFCDADDTVAPHWLSALVEALDDAELASGPIDTTRLNDARQRRWRPPVPADRLPISHGFLPYALGANLAVRRDVFVALHGFREDYPVGEDVELTWRAQLQGLRLAFAPDALVHYRYRRGLAPLLRQYVAYGTIGPRLYRDFEAAGMPASRLSHALGPWARLLLRLPVALPSAERRGDVLRRLAFRIGRLRGSLQSRVVYL